LEEAATGKIDERIYMGHTLEYLNRSGMKMCQLLQSLILVQLLLPLNQSQYCMSFSNGTST